MVQKSNATIRTRIRERTISMDRLTCGIQPLWPSRRKSDRWEQTSTPTSCTYVPRSRTPSVRRCTEAIRLRRQRRGGRRRRRVKEGDASGRCLPTSISTRRFGWALYMIGPFVGRAGPVRSGPQLSVLNGPLPCTGPV